MDYITLALIQNFGAQELILIFLVILLFFGAKRMPELFRSFGKSLKEFKKATSDVQEDIVTAMESESNSTEKQAQASQTSEGQSTISSKPEDTESAS